MLLSRFSCSSNDDVVGLRDEDNVKKQYEAGMLVERSQFELPKSEKLREANAAGGISILFSKFSAKEN